MRSPRTLPAVLLTFLAWPTCAEAFDALWSRTFQGALDLTFTLDPDVRTQNNLALIYREDGVAWGVTLAGSTVEVKEAVVPGEVNAVPLERGSIQDDHGRHLLQFSATSEYCEPGWVLPIPQATLTGPLGTALATYEGVLDTGRISRKGNLIVTWAGRESQVWSAEHAEVVDAFRVFDADGALTAELSEPYRRVNTVALADDGSAFAFERAAPGEEKVVVVAPTGQELFTYSVAGHHVPGVPGIAVSDSFSRIAFGLRDQVSLKHLPVMILDGEGELIAKNDSYLGQAHTLAFADDTHDLLLVGGGVAWLAKNPNYETIWELKAPEGFVFVGGAIDRDAKRIALVAMLRPDVPDYSAAAYPIQYLLQLVDTASGTVKDFAIPRADPLVSTEPPSIAPRITLADDGTFAAVDVHPTVVLYGPTP